ncbi:MAG: hypothetical protein P1V20_22490 [Verrucomicrobiales bacterium]|nr:hypothetical protein [Verrucomicrobiales bacterium]
MAAIRYYNKRSQEHVDLVCMVVYTSAMGFLSQTFYPAIVCLALATSSCTTALRQTRPVSEELHPVAKPGQVMPKWPERLPATLPGITSKDGKAPVPLGTYGHCQVLSLSPGAKDPLLLIASSTREPVRRGGKRLDFDLTVDEKHISRFVTTHHRLTVVELESAWAAPVRGTVLYLGSIMGIARPEQRLIATLRRDGWNVIACLPPFQLSSEDIDLPVNGTEDLPGAAKRFAHDIDHHIAERAYVAESAIAYVKSNRPDWLRGPTIVIGSSAGALALPAVVERIGPVDAAVLVGGGANIPGVMLRSSLELVNPSMQAKQSGNREAGSRPLTRPELDRFETCANEYMKLDPACLAPVLDRTPTLLLLGTLDTIVPAENGVLLQKKLHNPEVWHYPVGHNLLMIALPSHAGKIRKWINTKYPPRITPSPIPYEKRPKIRVQFTDNTAPEKKKRR